jgi:cytochrome c55X
MADRLGFVLALALAAGPAWAQAGADVPAERQAQLRHMLTHDCGSCHGLRLTGGLGPPLTADRLAGMESPAVAAIIRHGVPGTPMPPWKAIISDEEARWLADFMKGNSQNGSTTP